MTDAPPPIRVFLLDDHEIVRRGIKELLEGEPDIEVVGESGLAEEAARRILDGFESGRFLILTHPEVAKFEQARALDRDGWLAAMRKAQQAILRQLPEG